MHATTRIPVRLAPGAILSLALSTALGQGPLLPPGPPGETMKSLDQIETRVPIAVVPFSVTAPGSYYLVSNLTAGAGQNGIVVQAADVTIDLNGFTLRGSGATSGDGIAQGIAYRGLRVRNGILAGWAKPGYCGARADGAQNGFEDLLLAGNHDGIYAGERARFTGCQAEQSGGYGLRGGNGAQFVRCTVEGGGSGGIAGGQGCVLDACTVGGTSGDGIWIGAGSVVSRCAARGNARDGIAVGRGATVADCAADTNGRDGFVGGEGAQFAGCTASRNSADGFELAGDGVVRGCVADSNGYGAGDGAGIYVSGNDCRVEDNSVTDNDRGLQLAGTGTRVAGNRVRDNATNYAFTPGNQLNLLLCEVPETLHWPCAVTFAGTLTCSDTMTNGITVAADNVTIDLAGHALVGPGSPSKSGVHQNDTWRNLHVFGGKVANWRGAGQKGVRAGGKSSVLSGLQASGCSVGLDVGEDGRIEGCTATANDGVGIQTWVGGSVSRCTVVENDGVGIVVAQKSLVSACMVSGNGAEGIEVGVGTTVVDCTVTQNRSDGIAAYHGARVCGCLCEGNGYQGDGAGIRLIGAGNYVEGNSSQGNDRGIDVDSTGNMIVRNTCSGNTVNWDVVAGNVCLVVQATTAGAISGNSGGASPGSTDPNANYTY